MHVFRGYTNPQSIHPPPTNCDRWVSTIKRQDNHSPVLHLWHHSVTSKDQRISLPPLWFLGSLFPVVSQNLCDILLITFAAASLVEILCLQLVVITHDFSVPKYFRAKVWLSIYASVSECFTFVNLGLFSVKIPSDQAEIIILQTEFLDISLSFLIDMFLN